MNRKIGDTLDAHSISDAHNEASLGFVAERIDLCAELNARSFARKLRSLQCAPIDLNEARRRRRRHDNAIKEEDRGEWKTDEDVNGSM